MKKITITDAPARAGEDQPSHSQPPAIRASAHLPEVYSTAKPLPAESDAPQPARHRVDDARTAAAPIADKPAILPQSRPARPQSREHSLGTYLRSRRGYLAFFMILICAGIGAGMFVFSRSGGMQAQFGADAAGFFAPAQDRALSGLILTYLLGDGAVIIAAAFAGLTVLALPACILGALWKSAQFGFVISALTLPASGETVAAPLLALYIAASVVSVAVCALYCAEGCSLSRYVTRDPRPLRASLGGGILRKYIFRTLLFTLFSFLCFIIVQMAI